MNKKEAQKEVEALLKAKWHLLCLLEKAHGIEQAETYLKHLLKSINEELEEYDLMGLGQ